MAALQDRYRGSLLGLAIGDALGTTVEFQARGSFTPLTTIVGGGPFSLIPGQWTDDSSLALCLAESFVVTGTYDTKDQLTRFLRWYEEGHLSSNGECFDIGGTTRQAFNRFKQTQLPYCGNQKINSYGNGSLMRLAPVPLFYGVNYPDDAIDRSGDSSLTTHGHRFAVDCCRYYGALIIGALQSVDKDVLLSELFIPVGASPSTWKQFPLEKAVAKIAIGSYKKKTREEISSHGNVLDSMEAALWAFHNTSTFKDGCLLAVNLGNDADTVGAIYGMLAGAYYGLNGIPSEWTELCFFRPLILGFADELLKLSNIDKSKMFEPGKEVVQPSFEFQQMKECYDFLEKQFSLISRKLKPGPHRYSSLSNFDHDVNNFESLYQESTPSCSGKEELLSYFQKIFKKERSQLELILSRTTMKLGIGQHAT